MRMVLMNPGPVNVSERVRNALAGPDLCHREPDFSDLLARVRAKLLRILDVDDDEYQAVCFTGSGTAALEAATLSAVSPEKKLLVLDNGVYGDRIVKIAGFAGIETIVHKTPWGERPNLTRLEETLAGDPEIEVVAAIHHETTTGLINPVAEIGALCRRFDRAFMLDSISGMAGEDLDCKGANVGIVVGTANKCIQGQPGVSFVVVRRDILERMEGIPQRTLYLDVARTYARQAKGEVTFTPAVQIFYALEAALDELLEETVEGRIARYSARAAELREGFARLGLSHYLPGHLSNTITTLRLPAGLSYATLHDELKERGFVIYAGQGGLETEVFRIANMGEMTAEDVARFLGVLETILSTNR